MCAVPYCQTRPASALWGWLLVAMVLAQSLGLMHTIVHAIPPHGERQGYALQTKVHGGAITTWVADLFAAHDDESDCRLYDQFSHGDCVPAIALLCLPSHAVPGYLEIVEASQPPILAAPVRARGPPPIR